jgi:hypothetical protein
VSIVRADADYAYISGGAEAGERVIITAIESPINGMPVRATGGRRDSAEAEKVASKGDDQEP